MNIGIYIGNMDPTLGGGYTFQESLLGQLNNVNSSHQFTVFYKGRLPATLLNVKLKTIAVDEMYRGLLFRRKLNYYWRSFINKFRLHKKNLTRFSDLELAAMQEKIELIWLPSQDYIPISNIPYFFTVWDLQHRLQPYFPEVSRDHIWQQRETMFSNAIRKASYVITGTEAGKHEITRFYDVPEERICHGLLHPTPSFALHCSRQYPLPAGIMQPYVFYPAQFWSHKNHICILLALKRLKEKEGISINAVFVGRDFGNRAYIEKQVEQLGLSGQVKLFGFVERETLIGLYQHSLALVYPSFFGPENLPPLEAMALGVPVIAANMPGVNEQLGNHALLFNPADENEMAKHIHTIYSDATLRNEMIQRGHRRSRAFTIEHYMDEMMKLFDRFEKIRRCWEF
jgi:glycosyltransferase involved in cell wall biosynthesis